MIGHIVKVNWWLKDDLVGHLELIRCHRWQFDEGLMKVWGRSGESSESPMRESDESSIIAHRSVHWSSLSLTGFHCKIFESNSFRSFSWVLAKSWLSAGSVSWGKKQTNKWPNVGTIVKSFVRRCCERAVRRAVWSERASNRNALSFWIWESEIKSEKE